MSHSYLAIHIELKDADVSNPATVIRWLISAPTEEKSLADNSFTGWTGLSYLR